MATVAGLISRARLEIGDIGRSFTQVVPGDGVTKSLTLNVKPVEDTTLVLTVVSGNTTTPLAPGTDYNLDARAGAIDLVAAVDLGDTLVINGVSYRYFTDADWTTFIDTAYTQHNHGRGTPLARLDPVEDYLVALLGVIQSLWALMNDSAFDIDISTPEGVSIPRHQRFDQLMQMLLARQDQYNKLAAALNVGLNRIEMFDLRRVSRMTGRLVPVYVAQEIDEATPARRVFVPIDLKGATPIDDPCPVVDITLEIGVPFELDLALGVPIPDPKLLRASIRRNALGGPLMYFTVEVIDALTGDVKISLPNTSRTRIVYNGDAFWDIRLMTLDNSEFATLTRGEIRVIERPFL